MRKGLEDNTWYRIVPQKQFSNNKEIAVTENIGEVNYLNPVAEDICRRRYYLKDAEGNPKENWRDLALRVVNDVCKNESKEFKHKIEKLILETKFIPNSPCLVNSGKHSKSQGKLACFVIKEPDDSWVAMTESIATFGHVARQGGGAGISLSKIRPEGDPVFGSTHAKACGPIELMRMISEVMSSITQSGFRGMACLSSLRVDHPDILKFISCKQKERALRTLLKEDFFNQYDGILEDTNPQLKIVLDKFIHNFNISVLITDDFMEKVKKDELFDLVFNNKIYKTIKAREIFDAIAQNAWRNGDPGVLFYDRLNDGPYKYSSQEINTTNPCVTGDTLVATKNGLVPIKNIIKPTKVLSYHNGSFIWTNTKGSFKTKSNAEIVIIETENTVIRCTPEHQILVCENNIKNSVFKEGKDIKIGEMILSNPCGLGVSYGLDNRNTNYSEKSTSEYPGKVDSESCGRSRSTHAVVSERIRGKKDSSDGIDFWVDIPSFEEIFYTEKHTEKREKYCNRKNSRDEIYKCSRIEESILSMAFKSKNNVQNKKIQMQLVSISDCGESIFAKFLRVDNGDVFGFETNKLEDRRTKLHSAEWRDLQTRLLYLFKKMEKTDKNNRSKKLLHLGTKRIQNRSTKTGLSDTNRNSLRYTPICSKKSKLGTKNNVCVEKVLRITKGAQLVDVYDLSTDHESHNFVANGLVVHNCGEQCIPSNSCCNLASIDISKFYDETKNDLSWHDIKDAIHAAIRFLDDVIDENKYPTPEFEKWVKDNRPVGLGVMGFADLLLKMKIPYGKKKSLELAEKIASFFEDEAHKKSVKLAKERGTPKNCRYKELEFRRNITTLSVAPTGTISQIAGCSNGIEPIFSPTTIRYDNTGKRISVHELSDEDYFKCAVDPEKKDGREVTYKEHILVQSAFQKYVNASISKTINFSGDATVEDVKEAYMMAYDQKCKGITIYRDGSKSAQVLNTSDTHKNTIESYDAPVRPKEVDADIFRTTASGHDWHIIVGKVDGNPYELFAVNGSKDLPERGTIIKEKKKHYALYDKNGELLIENLSQQEKDIHINIDKETRRFSLELRHGIPPKFIVDQIDKSNDVVTSFSKAVSRIFRTRYITKEELISVAEDIACPDCAKEGRVTQLVPSGGCWNCVHEGCNYSRCG